MPCCGLHEYREKAALRYILAGAAVFWAGFASLLAAGLVLAWSRRGRALLGVAAAFLGALWRETMRETGSVPAHWSCRLSGRLFGMSPALAGFVYRHPEAAFIYAPVLLVAVILAAFLIQL